MGTMTIMQSIHSRLICACFAGLTGLTLAVPADARDRLTDHVYADSFGNLVIYSRAGYKRIVIGQGHLAEKFAAAQDEAVESPAVVRLDEETYVNRDCYRPPAFVKGRSYMYGLADGEMPVLSKCVHR